MDICGYSGGKKGSELINIDNIFLRAKNQPTSHATCKPNYFVISANVPYERRQMLLSRAMMALASNERINIGFDAKSRCQNT